jgi:hypothetical protein
MRFSSIIALVVVFAEISDAQIQYTSTGSAAVAAARATAKTLSPTSSVKGKTFDRFVSIFLENTDYDMAAADRKFLASYCVPTKLKYTANLAYLATQGITLSNYLAITHPSQGNYVASVGGALNGITGDSFTRIAPSVKTIVDLLDGKNVSWSEYGEDSPYSGFEGTFVNQKNGANDVSGISLI